jgi:hypothetical protein
LKRRPRYPRWPLVLMLMLLLVLQLEPGLALEPEVVKAWVQQLGLDRARAQVPVSAQLLARDQVQVQVQVLA